MSVLPASDNSIAVSSNDYDDMLMIIIIIIICLLLKSYTPFFITHVQNFHVISFGFIEKPCIIIVGRDSSVGTATRYGLDGPGIETQWERDFPHPSRLVLGPTQPPIQ
jgi:hypothetical protein